MRAMPTNKLVGQGPLGGQLTEGRERFALSEIPEAPKMTNADGGRRPGPAAPRETQPSSAACSRTTGPA
jgi:hypothetical protein